MCGASDTAHLSTLETTDPLAVTSGYRYATLMDRTGTRVNLTLPDELVRVLDRLGAVTGAGRATIIREWLIEAAPQLAHMASVMEDAQRGNVDAALKSLGRTMENVVGQAEQLSLDIKRDRRVAMRKRPK